MNEAGWEVCLLDKDALLKESIEMFQEIYQQQFASSIDVNHSLPIEIRSFRQDGPWRIFLLVCPWMLCRLFVPDQLLSGLTVPNGWESQERTEAEYMAMGPSLTFKVRENVQKANIQYHKNLGHFLIQPLIFSMFKYKSADGAFDAWSSVIQHRDDMMQKKQKSCGWQKELSRREMFSGMFAEREDAI